MNNQILFRFGNMNLLSGLRTALRGPYLRALHANLYLKVRFTTKPGPVEFAVWPTPDEQTPAKFNWDQSVAFAPDEMMNLGFDAIAFATSRVILSAKLSRQRCESLYDHD